MVKEWKDVDWKSLANNLKEGISQAKDGTIVVRTVDIAKSIGKPNDPLGSVFWFSFVNLFEEGIVVRAVLSSTREIVMQFRLRRSAETWQNLYEFAIEIEKLKDLKTGLDILIEQFY